MIALEDNISTPHLDFLYRDALRAFIVVAGDAQSLEEVNWARVKLADVLARGGDYAGAIAQLKMVPDSSSLSPARDRELPRLLKQAREENKPKIEEKLKNAR